MTLILGLYSKGELSIHGDKRIKGGHFNKRDDAVKITTLGETLFGFSGDYIGMEVIREVYNMWINDKENKYNLTSLIGIQSFINTLRENTLVKEPEICFMFINDKIQISILSSGFIEEMMFFDEDNGLLLIGSGTPYVIANYATQLIHKSYINIDEIFRICHRFDTSCSSEYDSLYLN